VSRVKLSLAQTYIVHVAGIELGRGFDVLYSKTPSQKCDGNNGGT